MAADPGTVSQSSRNGFSMLILQVLICGYDFFLPDTDLVKKQDDSGDKEQLNTFQELAARYDFKDWDFQGLLSLRLHPHRGEIEHIEYVLGQNPKTWQASKLFQEDVSRFQFQFPKGQVTLRDFRVRYRWKIQRRPGLTDEEARKRALEFLKAETLQNH
ncbi:MAG TPA: hypothetical protein PLB73_17165, partial [Leptospiraceae bacterium]|nr:hypothetical protein [Leptospiraceae bacterium]